MKLKYKLFISYLILIVFISIALFLLILQLKGIDHFVRMRIEQDVQEVVDLSHQQQILEDVYAQYLLYRIPGDSQEKYRQNLQIAMSDYTRNWQLYKSRRERIGAFSFFPPIDHLINAAILNTEGNQQENEVKGASEDRCDKIWKQAQYYMNLVVNGSAISLPDLKEPIIDLREELSSLSELIGRQAQESGLQMRKVADMLNLVVFIIMLGMVLISLLIAFLVARIFSRPLEELKTGIEQIAIQNFDVKIQQKPNDEIGELASAFEQMALRLKKGEEFKSEMLGQFTHEMKSPLVAINQAMKLLEKTIGSDPSADQKRLLSIINSNNETLTNLITNILHSSSYDAETMQLDLNKENIIKVFTNTIMKLAPIVKEKDIKVDLNFSSEKVECNIDKERMDEVFTNLLSNAIKFSPQGSTLQVTIIKRESTVNVRLRDQGIGIPPQEIPYIFEKMYRASNSRKISVKGTGLGLFITSQIVKAHGGKIKVRSKENFGTEFTIQLPGLSE